MENLSESEIVNAVRRADPALSIEEVLDRTRDILFQKKMKIVNSTEYKNIFYFIEALINYDMTREEITRGLEKYPEFSHLDDAIEFITNKREVVAPRCFLWKIAGKGKTRDTTLPLSL